jgi:hypothetical protein
MPRVERPLRMTERAVPVGTGNVGDTAGRIESPIGHSAGAMLIV